MKTKIVQIISVLMLATVLIGAAPQTAFASASGQVSLQSSGPTDPQEMEAFMDEFIPAQLEENHIPGGTVSVVKDGKLFFAKGYGYADLETKRPVIADQTLFRPGSTSKLFTWTAVMQLAEQGKVDLNADVNIYLKGFQIPATYPEPITLAHLLTHTAGFEEFGEGLFILDGERMMPLTELMSLGMPARIYAPGEVVAYSNYGTSLAGYIVEQVSGLSFEEYIEENIFNPLGMTHSAFRQPLPPELAGDLAVGYQYVQGVYKPLTEWCQGRPAGGSSVTATDMAKFMIAHLQDGRYENVRILQESTAQEMHRLHFTSDPRASSGMAYGFLVTQMNGQQLTWHAGGTAVFHTNFVLLPEHNVGLFVSFNSDQGRIAHHNLLQAFMDRYYPAVPALVPQPKPDFASRATRFLGSYQTTRHNETSPEKLQSLSTDVSITLTPEDMLQTSVSEYAPVHKWMETEDPLVFIRDDGHDTLIFQEDEAGNIVGFLFGNLPMWTYLKKSWFDTAPITMLWGLISLLFLLVTVLMWPLKFVINLLRRKLASGDAVPLPSRIARWVAWIFSAASLYFVVAFVGKMLGPMANYADRNELAGLFQIPPLTAALAVGMIVFAVLAWARGYWTRSGRMYYTLLTIVALAFLGWLNYWNLIYLPF
ncbi:MAG: beta-lactamase family protein [Chloroflexi bacterium]|nr:beta-lactamase family protein [Chloroflexota bacterium]